MTLTWVGPLNQVQITYRAADEDNGSAIGQHVGVAMIHFATADAHRQHRSAETHSVELPFRAWHTCTGSSGFC